MIVLFLVVCTVAFVVLWACVAAGSRGDEDE